VVAALKFEMLESSSEVGGGSGDGACAQRGGSVSVAVRVLFWVA
jgi:hypothetical protein